MSKPNPSLVERDERIWKRYNDDKIKQSDIARELNLTRGRIHQIVVINRNKQEILKAINGEDTEKDICFRDRLYIVFDYIDRERVDTLGRRLTSNAKSAIMNLFRKSGPLYNTDTPEECFYKLMDLRYDDIIHLRGFGNKKAIIIKQIQDTINERPEYYYDLLLKNCKTVCPRIRY